MNKSSFFFFKKKQNKNKNQNLKLFLWEERRAKQHFGTPSVEHADSTVSHINAESVLAGR